MNVFLLMADWITHLETRLATITHLQKSFKTMREQDLVSIS